MISNRCTLVAGKNAIGLDNQAKDETILIRRIGCPLTQPFVFKANQSRHSNSQSPIITLSPPESQPRAELDLSPHQPLESPDGSVDQSMPRLLSIRAPETITVLRLFDLEGPGSISARSWHFFPFFRWQLSQLAVHLPHEVFQIELADRRYWQQLHANAFELSCRVSNSAATSGPSCSTQRIAVVFRASRQNQFSVDGAVILHHILWPSSTWMSRRALECDAKIESDPPPARLLQ